MKRYPALRTASSFLRFASLIVIVCGIGASFWLLSKTDRDAMDILLTTAGILWSIIAGVLVYAVAEFFLCVMDIEANTRASSKTPNPEP